MKSASLFAIVAAGAIIVSCKQADHSSYEDKAEESAAAATSSGNIASVNPGRKFVRTADIRFKVKDVAKSTFEVERNVKQYGGFVVETNLKSEQGQVERAKLSQDSIVETRRFTVTNDMIIRVPNARLDSLLTVVQHQVGYLDYRVIKAEDVQFKMMANQMAQERQQKYNRRLEKGIDSGNRKLNDVSAAESQLSQSDAEADAAKIQNLDLEDQVAFSTVSLQLYQNESIVSEVLVNPDSQAFRTNFSTRLYDSLLTGWRLLEAVLVFMAQLWVVWIAGAVAYLFVRRNRLRSVS